MTKGFKSTLALLIVMLLMLSMASFQAFAEDIEDDGIVLDLDELEGVIDVVMEEMETEDGEVVVDGDPEAYPDPESEPEPEPESEPEQDQTEPEEDLTEDVLDAINKMFEDEEKEESENKNFRNSLQSTRGPGPNELKMTFLSIKNSIDQEGNDLYETTISTQLDISEFLQSLLEDLEVEGEISVKDLKEKLMDELPLVYGRVKGTPLDSGESYYHPEAVLEAASTASEIDEKIEKLFIGNDALIAYQQVDVSNENPVNAFNRLLFSLVIYKDGEKFDDDASKILKNDNPTGYTAEMTLKSSALNTFDKLYFIGNQTSEKESGNSLGVRFDAVYNRKFEIFKESDNAEYLPEMSSDNKRLDIEDLKTVYDIKQPQQKYCNTEKFLTVFDVGPLLNKSEQEKPDEAYLLGRMNVETEFENNNDDGSSDWPLISEYLKPRGLYSGDSLSEILDKKHLDSDLSRDFKFKDFTIPQDYRDESNQFVFDLAYKVDENSAVSFNELYSANELLTDFFKLEIKKLTHVTFTSNDTFSIAIENGEGTKFIPADENNKSILMPYGSNLDGLKPSKLFHNWNGNYKEEGSTNTISKDDGIDKSNITLEPVFTEKSLEEFDVFVTIDPEVAAYLTRNMKDEEITGAPRSVTMKFDPNSDQMVLPRYSMDSKYELKGLYVEGVLASETDHTDADKAKVFDALKEAKKKKTNETDPVNLSIEFRLKGTETPETLTLVFLAPKTKVDGFKADINSDAFKDEDERLIELTAFQTLQYTESITKTPTEFSAGNWVLPDLDIKEGYKFVKWHNEVKNYNVEKSTDLTDLIKTKFNDGTIYLTADIVRDEGVPIHADEVTINFNSSPMNMSKGLNGLAVGKPYDSDIRTIKGTEIKNISAIPVIAPSEKYSFENWVPVGGTQVIKTKEDLIAYLDANAGEKEYKFEAVVVDKVRDVTIKFVVPDKYKNDVLLALIYSDSKKVIANTTYNNPVLVHKSSSSDSWKDEFGTTRIVVQAIDSKRKNEDKKAILIGFDPDFDRYKDSMAKMKDMTFTAVCVPADPNYDSGDPLKNRLLQDIHAALKVKESDKYKNEFTDAQRSQFDAALLTMAKAYNGDGTLSQSDYDNAKKLMTQFEENNPGLNLGDVLLNIPRDRVITDPSTGVSVQWYFYPNDQLHVKPLDVSVLNNTGKVETAALYDIYIVRNGKRLVFDPASSVEPKLKVGIPVPKQCMETSMGSPRFKDGYTVYYVDVNAENKPTQLRAQQNVQIEQDKKAWFFTGHLSYWAIAKPLATGAEGTEGKVDAATSPNQTTKIPATGEAGTPLFLSVAVFALGIALTALRKRLI